MPRRKPPRRDPPKRPLGGGSFQRAEGDWLVRDVTAAQAVKPYRCPGCDHQILPGTPHLVCWPADSLDGVAERRHWHRGCWSARDHRRPW